MNDIARDTKPVGRRPAGGPSQLEPRHAGGAVDLLSAPPPLRSKLETIIARVARDHGLAPSAVIDPGPKSPASVGKALSADCSAIYRAKGDAMALASNLKHGDRPMASVDALASVFGVSRAMFIKLRGRSPHFRPRYRAR